MVDAQRDAQITLISIIIRCYNIVKYNWTNIANTNRDRLYTVKKVSEATVVMNNK